MNFGLNWKLLRILDSVADAESNPEQAKSLEAASQGSPARVKNRSSEGSRHTPLCRQPGFDVQLIKYCGRHMEFACYYEPSPSAIGGQSSMAVTNASPETSSSGRLNGSMRPAQMPLRRIQERGRIISASTIPPSLRSTVVDTLAQVAWSGSDVSVYQRFKKWDCLWTLMKANGQFFGSVQIFSNIQSHIVYFQLSQIYSLAAKRLAEFSDAFFQNVLQRRKAVLPNRKSPKQKHPRQSSRVF